MDEDQRRCRRRSGDDRISGLPDELLHEILTRLQCARAAARTSVLSRRWRHLWAHLPELVLVPAPSPKARRWLLETVDAVVVPARKAPGSSFLDTVDAALAGFLAPTLEKLSICTGGHRGLRIPAGRVTPWISFAAEHMVGELCIQVHLDAASDVSVHSDSLHSLLLDVVSTRRLEVVAPRLEKLTVHYATEAHICTPKLQNLAWHGQSGYGSAYDPRRHRFADSVGRHLRLLEIRPNFRLGSLIRYFDEVDELILNVHIPQGEEGYGSFLNEINELPKCKIFRINLKGNHHGLVPVVLHLLRSCNSAKKFSINLNCTVVTSKIFTSNK